MTKSLSVNKQFLCRGEFIRPFCAHFAPFRADESAQNRRENMELNAIANARLQDGKAFVAVNLDIEIVGKRERNAVYQAAVKR